MRFRVPGPLGCGAWFRAVVRHASGPGRAARAGLRASRCVHAAGHGRQPCSSALHAARRGRGVDAGCGHREQPQRDSLPGAAACQWCGGWRGLGHPLVHTGRRGCPLRPRHPRLSPCSLGHRPCAGGQAHLLPHAEGGCVALRARRQLLDPHGLPVAAAQARRRRCAPSCTGSGPRPARGGRAAPCPGARHDARLARGGAGRAARRPGAGHGRACSRPAHGPGRHRDVRRRHAPRHRSPGRQTAPSSAGYRRRGRHF
mmetsp:Transcript_99931/g.303333  ORF Transcript_99931/g.303333 Transcript_99931/m.303333 type:complete len:257 (-) Transcript_99931:369-1139(-)